MVVEVESEGVADFKESLMLEEVVSYRRGWLL